ncbi:hypothetical protein Mgra_00000362 [Meloidogyne graminicola]|uniref:UV excision repair protein RAD23 n=1 Tax=Meloidogyne graminicola TaxID=189291 RepID=A0A8T0A1G6_9BILA|nr:hypothetical protein Mgra_00000362 [Meloidogyne graminicola]
MPKIQLKTITQQSFEIDVEDSNTVLQLKNKIAETKGDDYPVEGQKLIYNGKVLEDEKIISELNIQPGKFVVVMVVKKFAQKPPVPSTTSTSTDETKKDTKEESKKEKTPPPKDNKKAEVPAEHQQAVDNITAMGYPREEVVRALKAAFFNADRAVEYLCNGIPEGLNLNQAAGGEASGDESGGEANANEGDGAQGIDFLANLPQFALLREMIRTDPAALPQILQQIAENRPELMEMIRNNQEQFLALLNAEGNAGEALPAAVGGGGEANNPGGPQAISIPVTESDRQAIERLCGMGFPEQLVIEAYLACDKNEDLAVNYILQRMEENQGGN